jgi:hypothetical protein
MGAILAMICRATPDICDEVGGAENPGKLPTGFCDGDRARRWSEKTELH